MRHIRELITRERPYDRYYYDSADYPEDYSRLNTERRRQGKPGHFIGKGTMVVGGTYVPIEDPNQPVTVDYRYGSDGNPEIYREYLGEARAKMAGMSYGDPNLLYLPRAVFETVLENMAIDRKRRPGEPGFRAAPLSESMTHGGGPLEAALACAALLDILTPGLCASVETSSRFNQNNVDDREVRRLVRYVDPRSRGGRVTVIDLEAGICDREEEAIKKSDWDYRWTARGERPASGSLHKDEASACSIISLAEYIKNKKNRTRTE